MKKAVFIMAMAVMALCSGFAQQALQPIQVEGRRINAAGETTRTYAANFIYYDNGKLRRFEFPDFYLASGYAYDGDYVVSNCTSHNIGGHPYYMECLEYTYEDGKIVHILHDWDQMNAPENWQYAYDEYGRLKRRLCKTPTKSA